MQGFGYIYKTTNLINGRIYIGQKKGSFDPSYLGSGWILAKALHKYGRENFKLEVIAYGSCREALDELEMKNIAEYREVFGNDFLYNITAGGCGVRRPCPPKIKEKIRKAALRQFSDPVMIDLFKKKAKEEDEEKRRLIDELSHVREE
jgi:group I intron endonuclease